MIEGRVGKERTLALGVEDSESIVGSGPDFGRGATGRSEVCNFGVTVVDVSKSSEGRRGSDFEDDSGRPRVRFAS